MGRKILLVEGEDDKHVMMHICGTRGLPHLDEIRSHNGINHLLESFPVVVKASEDGDILGIVLDADTELASRWQSLRGRLTRAGYKNLPKDPSLLGTILDRPTDTLLPRMGIWIMPDNKSEGILEDFLKFLVPKNSKLLDHVESSVKGIPDDERRFGPAAEPKAIIHTWLAWQEKPGKPVGTAITAKYLDPSVPQVDILVSWLSRLFT